ncbi:prolyl oligopeptidase family serine peptidase [Streptomyces sp. AK04-3B]|uniref:S9 family peptidase n=3 Tax=unclassified Streptomyces TaxID=2593676 RepID=UPI0029A2BC30|nr:prolyl oligopeptidase family serine peptidase [Streptomyces sp. AK04-3B]MDX3797311.1 prolyl oligopeptidase family serine peptidase [Streptomyces sp. AK04-3B]
MSAIPGGTTAYHDLPAFLAQPRVNSLALSADGGRLVATVQTLSQDRTRFVSGLWEIDPAGEREALRLTRSGKGESGPAFGPDGVLYFLSEREDGSEEDKHEGAALWALPGRGEAAVVARHPGGITAFTVARESGALAHTAGLLPGAADADAHGKLRTARKDAKVTAILYEAGPTRAWDRDLGPEEQHTFVRAGAEGAVVDAGGQGVGLEHPGDVALSPDGTRVAYTRFVPGRVPAENRTAVVVAHAATGEEVFVLGDVEHLYEAPVFTHDGSAVVCSRMTWPTYDESMDMTLVRVGVDGSEAVDLLPGFDNWPVGTVCSTVDDALFFMADVKGHAPVFQRDADGTVTRLTASGAYSSLCVAPDGRTLYALRNAIDSPPRPVRFEAGVADQTPVELPAPGAFDALPGTLTEVHANAADGYRLRGWLVLPEGASAENPAPLLVAVHGGPQGSWNGWTWRWNPWPFAARGYAVLLPDPALSTGYGQEGHRRGWGQWGGVPYTDVMALTDATEARDDIDAARTALGGGSYGGYMANRVATSTDRFKAIVSHAGLWDLRSFQGDTDAPWYFQCIFGDPVTRPERYEAHSPYLDAAKIRTPMLVIHGAKDYRVPVGQGAALFQDLQRFEVPAKYLYFPDENHWILSPGHIQVWYATFLNFLDHHVLGDEWQRPGLL